MKKKDIFFSVLTFVMIMALAYAGTELYAFLSKQFSPVIVSGMEYEQPYQCEVGVNIPSAGVDLENLYSPCAILIERSTGSVIAQRGRSERIYPASLTKMMTAVLAIEYTENLDEYMVLGEEAFYGLYAQEASMAGFEPGEWVSLRDLLYGILLPSGAECCLVFAERIAGSEEAFTELMNQKAQELGMEHTHFCNATGLHEPEHYSTVEDMAILLEYALNDESFREAFTSSLYNTQPSEQHPQGLTFYSTMFQELGDPALNAGEILGGKTGYTEEAGLCLASLAVVNGKEYILVTAGASGNHQTEPYHIWDAVNVYNQIG